MEEFSLAPASIPRRELDLMEPHRPSIVSPPKPETPKRWAPTCRTRTLLAGIGCGLFVALVIGTYVGPLTNPGLGPPSSGANYQMDLLEVTSVSSAICLSIAFWRVQFPKRIALPAAGILAMAVGVYLAFGYWVPSNPTGALCSPNCGFDAPYTLQGTAILSWGFFVVLSSFTLLLIEQQPRLGASQQWVGSRWGVYTGREYPVPGSVASAEAVPHADLSLLYRGIEELLTPDEIA